MKILILVIGILFIESGAHASDQLTDEIACNSVHTKGQASNKLKVLLKSNATSWAKQVQIIESSHQGQRVIGNIQVPLQPELVEDSSGYIPEVDMIYESQEATLSIRALNIQHEFMPLQGTGSVSLRLHGYKPKTVALRCHYAN